MPNRLIKIVRAVFPTNLTQIDTLFGRGREYLNKQLATDAYHIAAFFQSDAVIIAHAH